MYTHIVNVSQAEFDKYMPVDILRLKGAARAGDRIVYQCGKQQREEIISAINDSKGVKLDWQWVEYEVKKADNPDDITGIL